MVKIWGNIIVKNKIVDSRMLSYDEEPALDLYLYAVHELCNELDLAMPVVLSKHKNDMETFNLVKFLPADFIENVSFQRFDVEIFIDKDKDKK